MPGAEGDAAGAAQLGRPRPVPLGARSSPTDGAVEVQAQVEVGIDWVRSWEGGAGDVAASGEPELLRQLLPIDSAPEAAASNRLCNAVSIGLNRLASFPSTS